MGKLAHAEAALQQAPEQAAQSAGQLLDEDVQREAVRVQRRAQQDLAAVAAVERGGEASAEECTPLSPALAAFDGHDTLAESAHSAGDIEMMNNWAAGGLTGMHAPGFILLG